MKDTAFGIIPILRDAEGDRFLLIQHHSGHWGFPKGHADPGETAIAAACREFEEETGITAYEVLGNISFSEQYRFNQRGQTVEKTVTYFPAVVRSPEVVCQEQEIKDYAWVGYEDALTTITFDQARQLLTRVHTYLKAQPPSTP